MMWSICAVFICFCLEDFGLFGGSLSQCVWLWSQLCLRVWDELCTLCAEIQWALFGVSGYLSELFGVFVLDIKPLMFLAVKSLSGNWGFGSWQIWFWSLEPDMLTVLLSVSLVSWNLSLYHNKHNGASAHLGGYLCMLAMCVKGLAPDCPSANVFWAPTIDLNTIGGVWDRTTPTKSLIS